MDFSTALANGWLDSLNDLIRRLLGTEAVVSQMAEEAMLKVSLDISRGINAQKV
jgi:hypothetical protein